MRVVVVGSGAREHALGVLLARSAEVVVTPGNDGMSSGLAAVATSPAPPEELEADLVVVGPEAPLVDGLADRLRARGVAVFGPGADGARLEGSKAFMKELAAAAGVPTAAFAVFDNPTEAIAHLRKGPGPYVVKTDGLAGGKGVLVTANRAEAEEDVVTKLSGSSFGDAGRRVVLEEALGGEEASLLVLTDGKRAVPLPLARDYKRLGDGGAGPNTGGMGGYSPLPSVPSGVVDEAMARIIEPTIAELGRRGIDYRGVLYAGLMLTEDGPKLIEFNVRFGDPEAEVVLPRVDDDFAAVLRSFAIGEGCEAVSIRDEAAVCVVLASAGYPLSASTGDPIFGTEDAERVDGVTVFHAATRRQQGQLVTGGGRVLAVSALGPTHVAARRRAYQAAGLVRFAGAQYRRDIAAHSDAAVAAGKR